MVLNVSKTAIQNEFQHGMNAIWAECVSRAGRLAAGADRQRWTVRVSSPI